MVNNVAKNLTFSAHRKLRGMLDKRSLKDITKRSTKNISFVLPSLQTYFISSLKSKLIISTNSRSKRNTNCLKKSPKEDQFEALNEIFKKRTEETINIDDAYGKEFLTCVEGALPMKPRKDWYIWITAVQVLFKVCMLFPSMRFSAIYHTL